MFVVLPLDLPSGVRHASGLKERETTTPGGKRGKLTVGRGTMLRLETGNRAGSYIDTITSAERYFAVRWLELVS
jgi:hypothetical protein